MTSISQFSQPAVRFGTFIIDPKKDQMTVKLDDEKTTVKIEGSSKNVPKSITNDEITNGCLTDIYECVERNLEVLKQGDYEEILLRFYTDLPFVLNALRKAEKMPSVPEARAKMKLNDRELTNPVWDEETKSLTFNYNC